MKVTVKVSARAVRPRLKMMPHDGLVVVVPVGFDQKQIPSLLLRHEVWIQKVAAKLEGERQEPLAVTEEGLPRIIAFPHFAESWEVEYMQTAIGEGQIKERGQNSLLVSGDVANRVLCQRLLHSWLKHRAKVNLLPSLGQFAAAHKFDYAEGKVRLQHSRWGSCTSRRTITLNTKLLFLPEYLLSHIMLHELCHTVHLNHSASFWALVQQHDPLWRRNNNEMKSAWKYVPQWVSAQL